MKKTNEEIIAISVPLTTIVCCCLLLWYVRNRKHENQTQELLMALDAYRKSIEKQTQKKEEMIRELGVYINENAIRSQELEQKLEEKWTHISTNIPTETSLLKIPSDEKEFSNLKIFLNSYPILPNRPSLIEVNQTINDRETHHAETCQYFSLFLDQKHKNLEKNAVKKDLHSDKTLRKNN